MKYRLLTSLLFLSVISLHLMGQYHQYNYSRRIEFNSTWNKFSPPADFLDKVKDDFSDIRIVSIQGTDTTEVPFIIRQLREAVQLEDVPFKLINQSRSADTYYFIFELDSLVAINSITPTFKQQNFDWRINLEGSIDLKQWFSVTENYRILSINNVDANYSFTKVTFPDSKYRYYRLAIKSDVKPDFIKAVVRLYKEAIGARETQTINNISVRKDKNYTVAEFSLPKSARVCELKIFASSSFDYYRPVTIEYYVDSTVTEKGVIHNYAPLVSGVISSTDKNPIVFSEHLLGRVRLLVNNRNDLPLSIDSISFSGYRYEFILRTDKTSPLYLLYGNSNAIAPIYDLGFFTGKIPDSIPQLKLYEEVLQPKHTASVAPLFQNKLWLWLVMGVIIILLGFFTFRMVKKVA